MNWYKSLLYNNNICWLTRKDRISVGGGEGGCGVEVNRVEVNRVNGGVQESGGWKKPPPPLCPHPTIMNCVHRIGGGKLAWFEHMCWCVHVSML